MINRVKLIFNTGFFLFLFLFFFLPFYSKTYANGEIIIDVADTDTLACSELTDKINLINTVFKPGLVIHNGDLLNFTGNDLSGYNCFFGEWNKLNYPSMYVSGNHEYYKDLTSYSSWIYHNSSYNKLMSKDLGNFRFIGVPYNNYNPLLKPNEWADQKASEAKNQGKTPIFVMHYPLVEYAAWTNPNNSPYIKPATYLLRYPWDNYLKNLIEKYNSPLYLSGHIHFPYRMRAFAGPNIYEQLVPGNLGSRNYALLVIDNNKLFTGLQKVDKFPAIVITSPSWFDSESATGTITTDSEIRVKAIGKTGQDSITEVNYAINSSLFSSLSLNATDKLWTKAFDFSPYKGQSITLKIQAKDNQGNINEHAISVKISTSYIYTLPAPTIPQLALTNTPTPTPLQNQKLVIKELNPTSDTDIYKWSDTPQDYNDNDLYLNYNRVGLLKFDLSQIKNKQVKRAVLEFGIFSWDGQTGAILAFAPLKKDWAQESVTWKNPWGTAPTDYYDESKKSEIAVNKLGDYLIDITNTISSLASENYNNGIIIMSNKNRKMASSEFSASLGPYLSVTKPLLTVEYYE